MWYIGTGTTWGQFRIGLATSSDGITNWTKHPANPVLRPSPSGWDNGEVESPSIILVGDTLYMYYDGSPSGSYVWQIGLAKSLFTPLPLPPGTYTVGTGGNFATIQEAFNKLETDGVAGNVTLELIDELYTAPTTQFGFKLDGPIPGAGPNSRVTIKPAENKNVVIEGNNEGVIYLINTSYVTFDGVDITGSTTLTIHALQNLSYTYNDALDFVNNSDHNIIRHIFFVIEDTARLSAAGCFLVTQTGSAPDSNLIEGNFVKRAGEGFLIGSPYSTLKGKGNVIRGNRIGSETDNVITLGIEVKGCENAIIENNILHNLKSSLGGAQDKYTTGIDAGSSSGTIIRNNVISNLKASGGFGAAGIRLEGGPGILGSDQMVYNNMIYDLQSSSTHPESGLTGIQLRYQTSPKVYYNSVYLSGTGANQLGSAALYIYSNVTNADIKNNIFVNTRDEGQYCASAVYSYAYSFLPDYNDLYHDNTNSNNCLVRIGSTKYNTLADWQATGKDLNSVSKLVNFVSATDLHLTGSSNGDVDLIGTPIVGITTDIDGNTRNPLYPYKGADEASISLPVELTSFTAQAENQKVILRWTTATEINNNGFEIQRKVAESDFATVGFVRGEGTTTNQREYSYIDKDLADGKYIYRLKQVDYNGTYEYSNEIEVDVRMLNKYSLEQNYPNPFNPVTTIGYVLQEKSNARLTLLNSLGEEIAVLVNGEQDKGYHKVEFDGAKLSSGVYFYKLTAGNFISTRKMLLLK